MVDAASSSHTPDSQIPSNSIKSQYPIQNNHCSTVDLVAEDPNFPTKLPMIRPESEWHCHHSEAPGEDAWRQRFASRNWTHLNLQRLQTFQLPKQELQKIPNKSPRSFSSKVSKSVNHPNSSAAWSVHPSTGALSAAAAEKPCRHLPTPPATTEATLTAWHLHAWYRYYNSPFTSIGN